MNFSALSTHVNKHPCEGGKFVRVPCDFASASQYNIDLDILLGLRGIQDLQTCFIDAGDCDTAITLTVTSTGQRIICPPYSQGIFPLFFAGDSGQFSVACSSPILAKVFITNQPCIVPCVWPKAAVANFDILTEDGDSIITEDGSHIVTEDAP